MKIIIGTRGSKLALAQAEYVKKQLERAYPLKEYELKIIHTKGDRITDRPLDQIGDKGLFVREIELQLLDGSIDLAVHSMKDMPAELPDGLCFAKAWEREDPRDVLVLREADSLENLPEHAVIGTGSRRRAFQLLQGHPDLEIVGIRGNVDTRLKKMNEQKMDGIVLAAAGLHRLGRKYVITQYLDPEIVIPAPTQGTLALELRKDDWELLQEINALSDAETEKITQAERLFLKGTGGDCHLPIGAWAQVLTDGKIRLLGLFGNEEGDCIRCDVTGHTPEEAAESALKMLQNQGAVFQNHG